MHSTAAPRSRIGKYSMIKTLGTGAYSKVKLA